MYNIKRVRDCYSIQGSEEQKQCVELEDRVSTSIGPALAERHASEFEKADIHMQQSPHECPLAVSKVLRMLYKHRQVR
jgi:hypothetical protein